MNGSSLQGRTAFVTGASQSIGFASARLIAQDGATVVIMGRSASALESARDALRKDCPGSRIEMHVGDGCLEDDVKAGLAFAFGLDGRLDILVPTVGGAVVQPILMRDVGSVRREVEVNYISVFLMARYGVPFLKNGGSIVCISTTAASQAFFGMGMYGAAKAALERFVRAAALEFGRAGVRINAVRPGMTVPEAVAEDPQKVASYKAFVDLTPLGRIGVPDDVARVVRFLAGPESGWVTGQTFSVDGGLDQAKGPDQMDLIYGKETMDRIRAGKLVELPQDAFVPSSTSLSEPRKR